MMLNKEDFGLCLTLSFPQETTTNHRNPPPPPPPHIPLNLMPSLPWNHTFSSNRAAADTRSFLKGIDVNRLPSSSIIDCDEEEPGVSSPNSTLSSTISGGKRTDRPDHHHHHPIPIPDEHDPHTIISDEEDASDPSRKKLRLSKDQSLVLEQTFKQHNTLNPKQKMALAKRLGLRPRQVEVWFQNRRARTKLKQTEVDCEFLKRCCENLTEENRRLQKEVQELRALKMSPQFYMQMTPPTTLTICPSCERVAAPQPSHHRPMPINLWATPPPATRQFDGLRPRSS